jgi:hypothetical protein
MIALHSSGRSTSRPCEAPGTTARWPSASARNSVAECSTGISSRSPLHHERWAGHPREIARRERGLGQVRYVELGHHDRPVPAAVGRDLAVPVAQERVGLLVELDCARQPALVVEDAADEHEPLDEVRPQPGDQQRHGRAVAAADEVLRGGGDGLDERDRVAGHRVEGDRPRDVRGAGVTAAVGRIDAEALGQRRQVGRPGARVGAAGMQQHERRSLAVLLVVGAGVALRPLGAVAGL